MPVKRTVQRKMPKIGLHEAVLSYQEVVKWPDEKSVIIYGNFKNKRVPSRILEEFIQEAIKQGARNLHIFADGQHGIGGRIYPQGEPVRITIEGPVGQRCGSMGMFGTEIIVKGSVSDDVGWLNCGAKITVLGDVTNGAWNAAAQGILYVAGGGGARCDTMTKHNPRFDPPQSWYFRDVGDSFAEFKAGGIAVVCGVEPRNPKSVLGYRPCVGMVGGIIYFRGSIENYSEKDVKLLELSEQDWQWLCENLKIYLQAINKSDYYNELTMSPHQWHKLVPFTPQEKRQKTWLSLSLEDFRKNHWEKEVGQGGIFAEYVDHESTLIPYIVTGDYRRYRPVWANEKYAPPCAYSCPTNIPTHKRTALMRLGNVKESLELVLQYSPFPATVCGVICPNLCMQACTRGRIDRPISVKELGKASIELPPPKKAQPTVHLIAGIRAAPAGRSVAWQLSLKGHDVILYEATGTLGGKIGLCIPEHRLNKEILHKEIQRFREIVTDIRLNTKVTKEIFEQIYKENEFVVIAVGAHKPRKIPFQGAEQIISAYEFLRAINEGKSFNLKDKDVVIIGAGNVGMDAAVEAFLCGAQSVVAVDIQKPAAFGAELEFARKKGVQILWPKFTERYVSEDRKIYFKDGSSLPADFVVMAIGDIPELDFIPPYIHTEKGWIVINEFFQTSNSKVFAIGDVTGLGLVTHAIGHGRLLAEYLHGELMQAPITRDLRQKIPYEKIKIDYYERCQAVSSLKEEAERCLSCGFCRDCHMCEMTCYWGAITRIEKPDGRYEYIVDDNKCIACGFCVGICPCGVWEMIENI
ncbi:MAG: FAD-dependent oxidoreductase [Thermodesulfovibrionales bacterium]|nr:FAD-dependent oxidoreductase [Thermodesulfovibrionales bacterium]